MMLAPAHYPAQLWARQNSSGLDQDPIDIRLVVEHGLSDEAIVPFPGSPVPGQFDGDVNIVGDLTVGGQIVVDGPVLTNHDNYKFEADRIRSGTAQYLDHATILEVPPVWSFDQTTVERIKWVWTPGDAWESYTVRLGWLNMGLNAGNVRWRYYERRTVVNAGNPLGNWLTVPTQVAEITSVAPALDGNKYEDLAVDVPVEPLTEVLSVIERRTAGVPSNLTNDAGIQVVTATRT
jgi:hypothetical protein